MNVQPYSEIIGVLTVSGTLIIYDGGYYSLDGGATVSTDNIGPQTEISAPSGALTIQLKNSTPVMAKRLSVPAGAVTITGPGELDFDNEDIRESSRTAGVRVNGGATIENGAIVRAIGLTDGFYDVGLNDTLTVTGNSRLYGIQTGVNTTILGTSKNGVYCGGSIVVTDGSILDGQGPLNSYNSHGVFCDAGHQRPTALTVAAGCRVRGIASVGVYTGGLTVVDGELYGSGGTLNVSHGIQGDRGSLTVNPGGVVTGETGAGGYAGILMVGGYTVDGGSVTGTGGSFGVRSAGSGGITVTNGGSVIGRGADIATSSGVFVLNSDLTVTDGTVEGQGGRLGVYAGGDISALDSTVEGTTYAYGSDGSGSYGAVIANGTITAANGRIIENYTRTEYFDHAYQVPYQGGRNMTDYRNYTWTISSGTGQVESDPDGAGIRATESGTGTLTAVRTQNVADEVVRLDDVSLHQINIPVELTVDPNPEYSVTYEGNGATGGNVPVDTSNPYNEGDTVTVLDNTGDLSLDDFQFGGWSTSPDGGTVYHAGDTFLMPGQNVTLYAVWLPLPPQEYRVIYDGNGAESGTVPTDENVYIQGNRVTVLGNTGNLERPGYRFDGWALDPEGSGTIYNPGDTFTMPGGNVTLYAVWTALPIKEFHVIYNGNGAVSGTVPVDNNAYFQGDSVTVLGNTGNLVRPGYHFVGWSTASGGGTVYRPGDVFSMPGNDVILYAVWQADEPSGHCVCYHGNCACCGTVPVDCNRYTPGAVVTVPENYGGLCRPGFSFAGWGFTPCELAYFRPGEVFTMPACDVVLYAIWKKTKCCCF